MLIDTASHVVGLELPRRHRDVGPATNCESASASENEDSAPASASPPHRAAKEDESLNVPRCSRHRPTLHEPGAGCPLTCSLVSSGTSFLAARSFGVQVRSKADGLSGRVPFLWYGHNADHS